MCHLVKATLPTRLLVRCRRLRIRDSRRSALLLATAMACKCHLACSYSHHSQAILFFLHPPPRLVSAGAQACFAPLLPPTVTTQSWSFLFTSFCNASPPGCVCSDGKRARVLLCPFLMSQQDISMQIKTIRKNSTFRSSRVVSSPLSRSDAAGRQPSLRLCAAASPLVPCRLLGFRFNC